MTAIKTDITSLRNKDWLSFTHNNVSHVSYVLNVYVTIKSYCSYGCKMSYLCVVGNS